MRLLTIGSMYPPHHLGGYELSWRSWVRHARAQGHAVRVLASELRLSEAEREPEEPDVARDLRWYWRDHEFPRLNGPERLRLERDNARVLARELRASPNAVVWWPMGGMSLSLLERVRRAGLPSVSVVCDDWLVYGPRVDAWLRPLASRPALARVVGALPGLVGEVDLAHAARHLFLSAALRDRAVAAGLDVGASEVVHRGADADLFEPRPPGPWGWRLLYAGRIDRRKGIELAVRALAELPEAQLTIDGGGDEGHRAELERLAAELGVSHRVRFQRSARSELPEVYAAADAVVFPVLWDEPWGLVPLEAMAVGRPVVATGIGGSGEYLADGRNCLLFDPQAGASGLAERVRALAGDERLRERLREGGLATSGGLSAESFNRRILEVVAEEVSPSARA